MVTVSLAEARADMAALLDRVEQGEEVLITRDGARAAPPPPAFTAAELEDLAAFRESMPPLRKSSAELIREMRDEGY